MEVSANQPVDFSAVYREHHSFVWRILRHLGVDAARVDDAVQDTFLVVYRRLPEFAGRAALRTWLFAIARRVASAYRRSAAREAPRRCPLVEAEAAPSTTDIERAEAAHIVQNLLEELDRDKAVVFVLVELEQWQAPEIAAELALNLNTVYTRLRAARQQLDRLVRRLDARDHRRRPRSGAQVLGALVALGPPPAPPWIPGPARDPSVLSDLLETTWSIEPVRTVTTIAAAGHAAPGLLLAGAGLIAVLAFGPDGGARAPDPAPAPVTATTRASPPVLAADTRAAVPVAEPVAEPVPIVPPSPAPPLRPGSDGPASDLAAELALVEKIRAALIAGDARATLDLVTGHQRRFPAGVFVQEVAAAAIEAHCRGGERERARREAAAFLARWPGSPLRARVDALCPR